MKYRFRLLKESGEYITLYHNTPYKNVESILKNGLKVSASQSEKASGWQMTWATDHPVMNDSYGGNIIKFRLPLNYRYEKVNSDQYIIFDDIEPSLIDGVDYLVGGGGCGLMHTSQLPHYIDEFGKKKVKWALTVDHDEQLSLEDVKRLTPELDWGEEGE